MVAATTDPRNATMNICVIAPGVTRTVPMTEEGLARLTPRSLFDIAELPANAYERGGVRIGTKGVGFDELLQEPVNRYLSECAGKTSLAIQAPAEAEQADLEEDANAPPPPGDTPANRLPEVVCVAAEDISAG